MYFSFSFCAFSLRWVLLLNDYFCLVIIFSFFWFCKQLSPSRLYFYILTNIFSLLTNVYFYVDKYVLSDENLFLYVDKYILVCRQTYSFLLTNIFVCVDKYILVSWQIYFFWWFLRAALLSEDFYLCSALRWLSLLSKLQLLIDDWQIVT